MRAAGNRHAIERTCLNHVGLAFTFEDADCLLGSHGRATGSTPRAPPESHTVAAYAALVVTGTLPYVDDDDLLRQLERLQETAQHYLELNHLAEDRFAVTCRQRDELLVWAKRAAEREDTEAARDLLARIDAGAFERPRIRPGLAVAQRNLLELIEVSYYEEIEQALSERGLLTEEERRVWWRTSNRRLGRRSPDREFRAGYHRVVLDAARAFVDADFEV